MNKTNHSPSHTENAILVSQNTHTALMRYENTASPHISPHIKPRIDFRWTRNSLSATTTTTRQSMGEMWDNDIRLLLWFVQEEENIADIVSTVIDWRLNLVFIFHRLWLLQSTSEHFLSSTTHPSSPQSEKTNNRWTSPWKKKKILKKRSEK